MYEIDWTVENLVDKDFEVSLALGRVWIETARILADNLVVPFNVSDYGIMLEQYTDKLVVELNQTKNIDRMVENFESVVQNLQDAIQRFGRQSQLFQAQIEAANSGTRVMLMQVEKLNSRVIAVEKSFLTLMGLPDRPSQRHVIFSTSATDSYGGILMAGVRDTLKKCLQHPTDTKLLKMLNLQITLVQYAVESAIDTLKLD